MHLLSVVRNIFALIFTVSCLGETVAFSTPPHLIIVGLSISRQSTPPNPEGHLQYQLFLD